MKNHPKLKIMVLQLKFWVHVRVRETMVDVTPWRLFLAFFCDYLPCRLIHEIAPNAGCDLWLLLRIDELLLGLDDISQVC